MLRHDHESEKQEVLLGAYLVESPHELVASASRSKKRETPITAEGHEVQVALAVMTLQGVAHESQNPHP